MRIKIGKRGDIEISQSMLIILALILLVAFLIILAIIGYRTGESGGILAAIKAGLGR